MPFQSVPRSPRWSCTMDGMPVRVAAQSFAESSRRQTDRCEGPGFCSLYEELPATDEVSRYGTPRIHSAPWPVLINKANGHLANAMFETFDGERESTQRILTYRFCRVAVFAADEKLDLCIHRNGLFCLNTRLRFGRPLVTLE